MRLFFLLVCFYVTSTQAATSPDAKKHQTLTLALTHIENVMDVENDQAPYNRLLAALMEQFDIEFNLGFYPSGRSNFLLDTGKVDCIFPIALGGYRGEVATRFLEPVNRVSVHLFSYGDITYTSLEQVRRKTVVYPQGYLFNNLIEDNPFEADFTPVLTAHSAVNMIKLGRAEAYLDYLPDLRFTLTEEEQEGLNYSPENPIFSTHDSFECSIEKDTGEAIDVLNSAIVSLKESGQLQLILGKYYNL